MAANNNNDAREALLQVLPQVMLALEAEDTDSSSSDESDRGEQQTVPRDLPKSRHYFNLVDAMDDAEFHSHFRMGRGEDLSNVTFSFSVVFSHLLAQMFLCEPKYS